MRAQRIATVSMAALLFVGCGSDEEDVEVVAAAGEPTSVEVIAPAHGGTVVPAGAQQVEVVPQEDGTVSAYVVTPEPPPPEQTQITVRVPADDGHTHPVVLTWDPGAERYRGRLRRVHPVQGPVEVVVVVDGERYEGSAPEVVVVAPGPPRSDVRVVAAPPRARNVNVVVEAPSPPQPSVVIAAPPPPPSVVVVPPRPPGVLVVPPRPPGVVVVHDRGPRTVVVHGHHDNGLHLGHRRGHGHGHGRH